MIILLGLPLNFTWIWLSLLLYVAIGLCWIPVVFIQLRVARLSAQLVVQGEPPDSRYRRLMRWWYTLGWPAFFATLGIFVLMVFKPV